MAVYWSACLASVLFTWFAIHVKHEKEGIQYWLLVTFVAALPLIYISAIRYNVGADYAAYYKYYNRIVQGGDRERFEILYYLLNKGIALLHMSAPWMFAACAMLFLMPLYKMILSDSPYPYFSIFLLIATGYYFFFLNGTRQMIGAAIFMLAIPYIEKKNILPFIVLTLLSTGFHTMSIVFIATYAFSIWRIDNRFLLIVTGGLILLSNMVAGLLPLSSVILCTKRSRPNFSYHVWINCCICNCVLSKKQHKISSILQYAGDSILGDYYDRKGCAYRTFSNVIWFIFSHFYSNDTQRNKK